MMRLLPARRRPRLVLLLAACAVLALLAPAASSAAAPSDHEQHGKNKAAKHQTAVDATATVTAKVALGKLVYVGPFAQLIAGGNPSRTIEIGDESNVQDSVLVDAGAGAVKLGHMVILAHGSSVIGPATIGEGGACPGGAPMCSSFVSFNAQVAGAKIERDAMVSALARVAPGVTIPSGRKVLAGKNVASQAEVTAETAEVTEADRAFMKGVIEVNVAFAKGYDKLGKSAMRGINVDPGGSAFNKKRDSPTLAGRKTRDHKFRNRIIGDVRLADTKATLDEVMGVRISLRADEGEPFVLGPIASMASRTTFHALEHSGIQVGARGVYGYRSIVHGGPTDFANQTITGADFTLGPQAVFFRSRAADNVTVGARSVVQQSDLAAGAVVPPRVVMVANEVAGTVEW